MPTDTERNLIRAIARGDASARRDLFDAQAERLWSLLFRMTGDYDEAHDLVQETFVRAFRKAPGYDARGSAEGWLARIAVNLARDRHKRRRRRDRLLERWDAAPEASTPGSTPLVDRRVREAVEGLDEKHRLVVLMHDVEGYTHQEIGEALGIAPGSSRARLSRARAVLRERLADLRPDGG